MGEKKELLRINESPEKEHKVADLWCYTEIIQSIQEINWKVKLIAEYFLTNLKRLSCRSWFDLFPEEARKAY